MRRTLFVAAATTVFVGLMSATALAHVCFVPAKAEGAGSAGTATVILDIGQEGGEQVFEEQFIPGPDLQFNEQSGRFKGGFAELTFVITIWEGEIGNSAILVDGLTATAEVLVQNTVGGHAHFAGPGLSGCDGVGVDSLEACLLGVLAP